MSDEDTFCNLKLCSGMYNKVINNAHILKFLTWDKQGNSIGNINWSGVQRKKCCEQCRHVKFKDTMTKGPVEKQTLRTAQNTQSTKTQHTLWQHNYFCVVRMFLILLFIYIFLKWFLQEILSYRLGTVKSNIDYQNAPLLSTLH